MNPPPVFTAHNIRLDDGRCTKSADAATMDSDGRFLAAKRIFDLVFPEDKSGYSLVDLGCLEGGYATEFARLGFQTLGIEVRELNIACCNYVKQNVDLPNLRFVQDNVLNIAAHGAFDVAFCCGLFYHLDKPRAFLEELASKTRRVLFLQTHFSLKEDVVSNFTLSPLSENEGLPGRWYGEFVGNVSAEQREKSRWSSYDNDASFWIQREHLLQLIKDSGFDVVFEQFDDLSSNIARYLEQDYTKVLRGTFVGIKNS
jgi:SAM-dependent methyltransferase